MSKLNAKFEGSSFVAGLDANEDGANSISVKAELGELLGELTAKGEAKIEVKVLSIRFDGMKLLFELDTDKDGEKVLTLSVDIPESFEEVAAGFAKK